MTWFLFAKRGPNVIVYKNALFFGKLTEQRRSNQYWRGGGFFSRAAAGGIFLKAKRENGKDGKKEMI